MADRVAVLSQGKLEQFAPPSDVYDRPQTLFVNTFVGSTNRMSGTIVSADTTGARVRLDAGGEIVARAPRKTVGDGGRVTVCIRPEHLLFRHRRQRVCGHRRAWRCRSARRWCTKSRPRMDRA